jgi:hypothetical protein
VFGFADRGVFFWCHLPVGLVIRTADANRRRVIHKENTRPIEKKKHSKQQASTSMQSTSTNTKHKARKHHEPTLPTSTTRTDPRYYSSASS